MSWFEDSYRMLFFDFHNHDLVKGVASEFNADLWAEKLLSTGVQAVNIFTNDMFGWKYYRKGKYGYIHPSLPEGLDMVEETIKACHKCNIRVIGYYAPQRPEICKASHPEWLRYDAEGNGPEKMQNGLCKLGVVAEDEILPQIEELTRCYDMDGIFYDGTYSFGPCYCKHCRKEFKRAYGFDIPLDVKAPIWKIYLKWLLDKHTEFKKKMIEAAHRGNPEILVGDNWAYTHRLTEIIPEDLGYLICDVPPDNQQFNVSVTARNFALTGKPFVAQNTAFLKWWGEWGMKHPVTLKRECATLMANGGHPWIGYQMYPEFSVPSGVMNTFKDIFAFIKEREEFSIGSIVEPYVGVVTSSYNRGLSHTSDVWPDLKPIYGIHKLLTDSGIHYNMITDQYIEKINDFKAVIISDIRYMPEGTIAGIKEYVKNGGSLLVTGATATLDKDFQYTGSCAIEELLGVQWKEHYPYSHGYMEITDENLKEGTIDMPIMIDAQFGLVKPTTSKVLAGLTGLHNRSDGGYSLHYSPPGKDTGYPSIVINEYGNGKVVYIPSDIFQGYYTGGQWNLAAVIKNILYKYLIKERVVEVEAPSIEVVVTRKELKKYIHLINLAGEMPATDVNTVHCNPREVIPQYNIRVKVFMTLEPTSVILQPVGETLPWKMEDNYVSIVVPKLEIHNCIEIVF